MSRKLMNALVLGAGALTLVAAAAQGDPARSRPVAKQDPPVERGRYLVKIAGCNDCHTAGYAMSGGKVPESQWLTGDSLGWRGPWGTTYAVNLRLYMAGMSEAQWVARARTLETRPPMPWFALRDMTDQDLKALYRYVKSLGAGGEPAPAYVAAGSEPRTVLVPTRTR
jgi:mono/diheme cytochrome c family protein